MKHLPFFHNSFNGIWAAASFIHFPKSSIKKVLRQVLALTRPRGILAATFLHGKGSGYLPRQWIPGRYMCQWLKPDLKDAIQQAGWHILSLQTVCNRERKGRWLNVLAQRPEQIT